MRSVLAVCLLAGTAAADESPRPMQPVSLGIGMLGTGGKLAGLEHTGIGLNLEGAFGHGNWQGFVEGSVSSIKLGPETDRTSGRALRAGLGARWHARSFELGDRGSFDLYFEAFSGWSRYRLDDRGALSRPDVGAGIGYGIRTFFGRSYRDRGMRISARIYFAPTDQRDERIACRGDCPMTKGNTNSGLMAVFGGYL